MRQDSFVEGLFCYRVLFNVCLLIISIIISLWIMSIPHLILICSQADHITVKSASLPSSR